MKQSKPFHNHIKTGICVFGLLVAMAFFSSVCRAIISDFTIVLVPGSKLIGWGVKLGVSTLLLSIMISVVAVLVRPVWVALLAYLLAAAAYALIVNGGVVTLIVAAVFMLFLFASLRSINGQLENQINFSIRPVLDMKFWLFVIFALLVTVAFGAGYSKDSARRAYVIPPEIRAPVVEIFMSQAKSAIDKQKIPTQQKKEALKSMSDKVDATLNDLEKRGEALKDRIPIIIDVAIFFTVQIVFWLLGIISMGAVQLVFFALKLTHFSNVKVEEREVKRLVLE